MCKEIIYRKSKEQDCAMVEKGYELKKIVLARNSAFERKTNIKNLS